MALKNLHRCDEFFEKILRAAIDDENNIYNVECIEQKPATIEGLNLLSIMTRFSLKYTCKAPNERNTQAMEKIIQFILKEEPTTVGPLKMTRDTQMFAREYEILGEVLPKINAIVGRKIGPKCIFGTVDKPPFIIMEDLAVRGFSSVDPAKGLSKSHTLMVIEMLAKFHAGSVALNEKERGSMENIQRHLMSQDLAKKFFGGGADDIRVLCQEIPKWSDEKCSRAIAKLEKLSTGFNFMLGIREGANCREDEFCTLIHGDCWTNNFMFRCNEKGEAVDICIVDFQLTGWSSPALDLMYFLCICPELDVKVNEHEFLLQHYLKNLSATMESIGCKAKPPTMQELRNSMRKRRTWAVFAGLLIYPKRAHIAGFDLWDDNVKKGYADGVLLNNPTVIASLKRIIPWMNEQGYLDTFDTEKNAF